MRHLFEICSKLFERNWVFATNSYFIITISLEPNVADLRYFKLWILLDKIVWFWNIKGLQHRVLKLMRFKYLILFQRLNCFEISFLNCKEIFFDDDLNKPLDAIVRRLLELGTIILDKHLYNLKGSLAKYWMLKM